MQFILLKPKQSINKAYLKEKVSRSAIDLFKRNFSVFLNHTNSNKNDEEHLKSQLMFFLRDTWFKDVHHINPIGKNDMVIHTGKSTSDPAGVIVEVKSITNKVEMLSADKPNAKALHELVLYYLRERIDNNNNEIKFLVATNIDDWFIFDANEFDKKIFRNAAIKKLYELKKTDNKDNPFFYEELRKLLDNQPDMLIETTNFQIREFENIVSNADTKDDNKLIAIYKLLSPAHLLKLSFANDSNSLQPKFYTELLHFIGLTEIKEGSKKLIQRKKEGTRDAGSLLESAIIQLDSHDKLSRIDKPSQYGETKEERLYTVALELVITWVNRILFLKLLEAQLLSYHKGDRAYTFLNREKIKDFDDLDKLFFRVLAKLPEERTEDIQKLFGQVPYLNSSLFEPTELEHQTLFINGLEDYVQLPIIASTVLKDNNGKILKGSLVTLDYLFSFLDAYDFSSEGAEDIQEDNKTLINASVLGLIFEKINGYKDGSFFTPGFITMYMCRETIRRAVVQKFNEVKGWDCKELTDLYNKIEDSKEANSIINGLKICDPAVGSGHFLVSALNEIIAIKADLNILLDREGRRLKEYQVEVVNDELSITDEEGTPFSYNINSKESQRFQEALFHEKQTIIENCLFGVDINPNSVKICRLRLWIELLKNAYYKTHPTLSQGEGPGVRHLETLPNIDINIKTGNSLISRFALDADLKKALKKSKFGPGGIDSYRFAVKTYQNARNKEEKREMEQLIRAIKSDFRTEIANYDPRKIRRAKLLADRYLLTGKDKGGFGMMLFEDTADYSSKNAKLIKERAEKLLNEVAKIDASLEEDEKNIIYENAFEWRFEFPQVLNDEGDFVGFDVVIGNPPYIPLESFSEIERRAFKTKYVQFERKYETSVMFIVEGFDILNRTGILSYIAPITWQTGENYSKFRQYIFKEKGLDKVINLPFDTFEDAFVETAIYIFSNIQNERYSIYVFEKSDKSKDLSDLQFSNIPTSSVQEPDFKLLLDASVGDLMARFNNDRFINLGEISKSTQGLSSSNFLPITDTNRQNLYPFLSKGNVQNYVLHVEETFLTDLDSKPTLKPYYEAVPKILIRRIINRQDRLSVGYCDLKMVFKKDINPFIIIDNSFNTKYILGILASKFISHLYLRLSSIASKDDFRQTTLTELRKLSIPVVSKEFQDKIASIADNILNRKKDNFSNDTSSLEKEIDRLVYQLYGLTEEEIKIVEGEG